MCKKPGQVFALGGLAFFNKTKNSNFIYASH
jgi:hypothetical protein